MLFGGANQKINENLTNMLQSSTDGNDVAEALNNNQEFIQLNALVQNDIQSEIMSSIRWKINGRQETVNRIKRMMDIIDDYNRTKANEDKKQMAEIADYLQNYSDMTFNEYKKLKEQS